MAAQGSLMNKLEAIVERYNQLEERLANPELIADQVQYQKVGKDYKDLKPLVEAYREYADLMGNIETARAMLADSDLEMKEMAQEELNALLPRQEEMEENLRILLVPKDPEDSKDVIFEIRSGTGGDEASLFAGDLYDMYTRFFQMMGWKVEVVDVNEGSVGGYNKIVLEISGEDVYGKLKFESGAHRVQRVPKTESQGRVHTSAATVAVIPKFEPEDINISKADLKVDTYRASGAGGQHVNKTESAIRITHIPTGTVAESQESRHQHKNRDIAMQRLLAEIHDKQRAEEMSKLASQRKSLVGTGDRSDKIRTYNYPQNRLTDHRINLTLYNLDQVVMGQIDNIIEALRIAETTNKMQAEESFI